MQVKVDLEDVCKKKYIYLDWNVVKYIKEPRNQNIILDETFRKIVKETRSKYVYPYSEAHFIDRAHNYKEEYKNYILNDLHFFENISQGYGLALKEGTDELNVIKYSVVEAFENVLHRKRQEIDFSKYMPYMQPMNIDVNCIEENSLFYKAFQDTNGYCDKEIFDEIAKKIVLESFTDINIYKKFRIAFNDKEDDLINRETVNAQYYGQIKWHFHKLKEALELQGNEERLAERWKEAVTEALSLYFEPKDIQISDLMSVSYCLLDLHSDFSEKLKKYKNTLDNVYRDSKNIWYASQAKYFITEDAATRKKAKFIYKVFDKKVKVWSMQEFVNNIWISK